MDTSVNNQRCSASLYIDDGFNLDYFRYLFPRDSSTGHYRISSADIVGSILTYSAQPSMVPYQLPHEKGKTICTVDIPMVDGLSRNQLMQYSKTDMARINQILSSCFELDFYRYYMKGAQFGYEKKDIVEAYVISRNLVTGQPFDTLHKRVFRREMEIMKRKVDQLKRKAKYFFDEADTNPIPKP